MTALDQFARSVHASNETAASMYREGQQDLAAYLLGFVTAQRDGPLPERVFLDALIAILELEARG